jgi:heparosan-N-sulfate-glucuronate 5-epimerase
MFIEVRTRLRNRSRYLRRVFASYVLARNSQLTFWHEAPCANPDARYDDLGPYYMTFEQKALYPGPFDQGGIPLLDYHGDVGQQYYSIAISQYALGNYNLYKRHQDPEFLRKFLANADWLVNHLQPNERGVALWSHDFDFEYFKPLKAPWYSGLAQGQGLSVLLRAYAETGDTRYLAAAENVYASLNLTTDEGGVLHRDDKGYLWIEEYLVNPPTHILNGFMWAMWGIYDYYLVKRDSQVRTLFDCFCKTVTENLQKYDTGFWSLYELTPQRIKSIASPFYHRLHIVQLQVMHSMTGDLTFYEYAKRWQAYLENPLFRTIAVTYKTGFKLIYY